MDAFHDADSDFVYTYMSLGSLSLENLLSKVSKKFDDKLNNSNIFKDLSSQLEEREFNFIRAMLFMFHMCHIIMFVMPNRHFDLKFLRLFRILQIAKQVCKRKQHVSN